MSYVILGRAIKNEYLAIGTLLGTAGITFASLGGSKKDAHAPSGSGKQSIEQVKESVKFSAGSSEEEEFIKKFIADAEKESKH